MAARQFKIRQGDTKDDLEVTLRDAVEDAVDVTGATVKFSMWGARDHRIKIKEGSVTLVTPSSGIVKYVWQDGDTNQDGDFEGEFEVTYSGGDIQTFPNTRSNVLTIDIERQIA